MIEKIPSDPHARIDHPVKLFFVLTLHATFEASTRAWVKNLKRPAGRGSVGRGNLQSFLADEPPNISC